MKSSIQRALAAQNRAGYLMYERVLHARININFDKISSKWLVLAYAKLEKR